jgi:hypothetical protein
MAYDHWTARDISESVASLFSQHLVLKEDVKSREMEEASQRTVLLRTAGPTLVQS